MYSSSSQLQQNSLELPLAVIYSFDKYVLNSFDVLGLLLRFKSKPIYKMTFFIQIYKWPWMTLFSCSKDSKSTGRNKQWIAVIIPYSKCFSGVHIGDAQPIPGTVMRYGVVGWSHLRQEGFQQGEQWAASRRSISKTEQSLSLSGCSLWEAVGMVTKLMDSEVNWLCWDPGSDTYETWNLASLLCVSASPFV